MVKKYDISELNRTQIYESKLLIGVPAWCMFDSKVWKTDNYNDEEEKYMYAF